MEFSENCLPSTDLIALPPPTFYSFFAFAVGMKFECLDPLNQSFLELKVATCLALLTDGYLRIGFDGPDVEEDVSKKRTSQSLLVKHFHVQAMPIHCTSPFLFPANYAAEHGIALSGPKGRSEAPWGGGGEKGKFRPKVTH